MPLQYHKCLIWYCVLTPKPFLGRQERTRTEDSILDTLARQPLCNPTERTLSNYAESAMTRFLGVDDNILIEISDVISI